MLVLDARHEERFDAAAFRWAGRLAIEARELELAERGRRPVGAPAPPVSGRRSQQPGPRWLS